MISITSINKILNLLEYINMLLNLYYLFKGLYYNLTTFFKTNIFCVKFKQLFSVITLRVERSFTHS